VSEKSINVKDNVMRLLAGSDSKTWVLSRWFDRNGRGVGFDPCMTCIYEQTFYAQSEETGVDGEHKWHDDGLRVCGEETVQCNTYGPEGNGWFYFDLDPFQAENGILIGTASKAGYVITVDDNSLHLSIGGSDFYYIPK